MSLASRIALGNTGESCSPAAIFLTENGEKHISESKRHHNKVIKKRRNKSKKVDQGGGKNVSSNVERSSLQTARVIGLDKHDSWVRLLQLLNATNFHQLNDHPKPRL